MGLLFALIFALGLPAAIAWMLARTLDSFFPNWSFRRRTAVAALTAGFLPMILPLVAVLSASTTNGGGRIVPAVALVMGALVLALLVGLPVAFWSRRKRAAPVDAHKVFD